MKQLSIIQQALKAPKDKFNGFGKYKYRKAEDILEAIKPLLKTNNLSLTLSDEVQEAGGKVFLATTAMLFDEAGEIIATTHAFAELCTHTGMSAEQSTGAASSYARKYALCGMFAIDDSTNDPDTMKPEQPAQATTAQSATQPTQQPAQAVPSATVQQFPQLPRWVKDIKTVSDANAITAKFNANQKQTPEQRTENWNNICLRCQQLGLKWYPTENLWK